MDAAPTEIYPLPFPAALPFSLVLLRRRVRDLVIRDRRKEFRRPLRIDNPSRSEPEQNREARIQESAARRPTETYRTGPNQHVPDRKSTRLNSSHLVISYAVFC